MAVWQAQLELSLATRDVDGFWRAAPHLPAARFDRAEVLAYRAWLAASNDDREWEESALASLIEDDPGNANALERLAVLNVEFGRHREAESLHRQRDEVTKARERRRSNPAKWDRCAEPRTCPGRSFGPDGSHV